jgi:hypothetical protein
MKMKTSDQARAGKRASTCRGDAASRVGLARRVSERLRSAFVAAAGDAVGGLAGQSMISPVAERELAAIRTFAHFIAKNPDMPADHRKRFLTKIVHSCEELREELS